MSKMAGAGRSQTDALTRLLKPRTVAFVGMRDATPELANVAPTLSSDADVFFVSQRHDTLLGQKTYSSVADIGRPLDAVFAYMSAERSVVLAEECAGLDCGGMVFVAGAFAEIGDHGAELQRRLLDAAERGDMAMVGPNGLGYVNVNRGLNLTLASQHRRRSGGISIVSQSGSTMSAVVMALWERPALGVNVIVSAGNEAATDLADYVDYLAQDDDTTAIALVIETIRRPDAFFAAVRRAQATGKPVVALKLARNPRTREMATSHTGALAGDAWAYDVALEQAGILTARDTEELADRLAMVYQFAAADRRPVRRLGVITMLGGIASLAYDIAVEEGVQVPEMPKMADWIRSAVPGVTIPNPLDATGLAVPLWPEIVQRYAQSDEIDSLLFLHPLEDNDDTPLSHHLITEFVKAARSADKPFVLSNVSGPLGGFAHDLVRDDVLAVGHGVRSSIRGLESMDRFARRSGSPGAPDVPAVSRPGVEPVHTPDGSMLPFGTTMELLVEYGVPVAPYRLVGESEAGVCPDFPGPYVVKLADIPHRTEYGAVRVGVGVGELDATLAELRALAGEHDLPATAVVQPVVDVLGETIVGVQGASELGPVVVFGIGGILVELLGRVGGRMAPLTCAEAEELIAEFEDLKIMHGHRGGEPWDLDALADILVGVGRLAAAGRDWIGSIDVNPLTYGAQGFLAVDGLCFLSEERAT